MARAVKLREQPTEVAANEERRKRSGRRDNAEALKEGFKGKKFSDLSKNEKDELLKALAVAAGLILE